MNKLIDSLRESFIERLKNPLIGTFVLSWLFTNGKLIFSFVLLENNAKINLLNSLVFDWKTDILVPLSVTVAYLYLIPIYNFLHEKVFDLKLSEARFKNKNEHLIRFYESQKQINSAKVKSQDTYLITLFEKELDDWDSERKTLNHEKETLNRKINNKEEELVLLNDQIRDLSNQHSSEIEKLKTTTLEYRETLRINSTELQLLSSNLQAYAENIKVNLDNHAHLYNYTIKLADELKIKANNINNLVSKQKNLTKT